MTSAAPHIPILRQGQPYESLDVVEVRDHRGGQAVASVSQANAGLLKRDLARLASAGQALRRIPAARLLEMTAAAGELFLRGDLPCGAGVQSPRQYVEALSATSGLPHTLVRRNMDKLHQVFTQMPTILAGLTRGLEAAVLDGGLGRQAGVEVCYFRQTASLGAVLPSNSPGVNSLWMPAIALKTPVVLKPGREEPWTPLRIMQAFIAAGVPAEAFSFYPTDHEGAAAILRGCGRALLFGDDATTAPYAGNPAIQIHGAGRSKVLIGNDRIDQWPRFLDTLVRSIAENGGRSCINASAIVVPRHGRELAEALAQRLAAIPARPMADPEAQLAAFANPQVARAIDAAITQGLGSPGAEEVTARCRPGPRLVSLDGSTFLLPTLVRCDSFQHPLANREFLFPYASVVEVAQDRMLAEIGPSLVVTAITEDQAFIDALLACPQVDRLNLGATPTCAVQWDQPHEGNLFEFLYRRRAIQRAPLQQPAPPLAALSGHGTIVPA